MSIPYNLHKLEQSVLFVGGSPRKNGNSDIILKTFKEVLFSHQTPIKSLQLRDITFSGCIGCERCRKDKKCTGLTDELTPYYSDIINSQGLVLVSPAHNYNITSWMKAFIDRLYCYYTFNSERPRKWSSQLANQGRKAVIVAICEQKNKQDMGFTLDAMRLPLLSLGYDIFAELPIYGVFGRGKVKENNEIIDKVKEIGTSLVKSLVC